MYVVEWHIFSLTRGLTAPCGLICHVMISAAFSCEMKLILQYHIKCLNIVSILHFVKYGIFYDGSITGEM